MNRWHISSSVKKTINAEVRGGNGDTRLGEVWEELVHEGLAEHVGAGGGAGGDFGDVSVRGHVVGVVVVEGPERGGEGVSVDCGVVVVEEGPGVVPAGEDGLDVFAGKCFHVGIRCFVLQIGTLSSKSQVFALTAAHARPTHSSTHPHHR